MLASTRIIKHASLILKAGVSSVKIRSRTASINIFPAAAVALVAS
jgi:hypothetical protein